MNLISTLDWLESVRWGLYALGSLFFAVVTAPGLGCWLGHYVLWGEVHGVRKCWGCGTLTWPHRRLFGRRKS